jgi:hypothetical protein
MCVLCAIRKQLVFAENAGKAGLGLFSCAQQAGTALLRSLTGSLAALDAETGSLLYSVCRVVVLAGGVE